MYTTKNQPLVATMHYISCLFINTLFGLGCTLIDQCISDLRIANSRNWLGQQKKHSSHKDLNLKTCWPWAKTKHTLWLLWWWLSFFSVSHLSNCLSWVFWQRKISSLSLELHIHPMKIKPMPKIKYVGQCVIILWGSAIKIKEFLQYMDLGCTLWTPNLSFGSALLALHCMMKNLTILTVRPIWYPHTISNGS